MMRIALVSDAWAPQINGVVRTLATTIAGLRARGYDVTTVTPDMFVTVPCPGYREIRLAVLPGRCMRAMLDRARPDIVHIATEGPLGWAARGWCKRRGVPFTSAFHTRFPDYLAVRTGLPPSAFWPVMRWFHAGSRAVLASTPRLAEELRERGIENVRIWSRGVDLGNFNPRQAMPRAMAHLPRPIMLYVGRVSAEKNLPAFVGVPVAGSKVIVGDGPAFGVLKDKYWDATFLGSLQGRDLAAAYAAADVFVFPSRTDTFGLVMVEALACGIPVAAFPVQGPLDIIGEDGRGSLFRSARPIGALSANLAEAIGAALKCDKDDCADFARRYDWNDCIEQFASALVDASGGAERFSPELMACAAE